MSGTIPIFMRPSQMSSSWTSRSARKKDSGMEKEMSEMPRWPGTHGRAAMVSPAPRYVDSKAADMMFPSSVTSSLPLTSSNPSRGPPVPPKEAEYQTHTTKNWDRRKYRKGMRARNEWDVESGFSEESDRQPLDPRSQYNARW